MRVHDIDGAEFLHLREVESERVHGGLELLLGVAGDFHRRFRPVNV